MKTKITQLTVAGVFVLLGVFFAYNLTANQTQTKADKQVSKMVNQAEPSLATMDFSAENAKCGEGKCGEGKKSETKKEAKKEEKKKEEKKEAKKQKTKKKKSETKCGEGKCG